MNGAPFSFGGEEDLEPSFDAETEQEFRGTLLRDQRNSTLICAASAIAIWSCFAVFDIVRVLGLPPGDWRLEVAILFISRAIVLGGLVAVAIEVRRGFVRYDRLVVVIYLLLGLAVSLTANMAKTMGTFAVDSAQVAVVMAAFLPIGLRFRQALFLAVAAAVMSIVTTVLVLSPALLRESLQLFLTILVALPLAAMGGYLRERSERKQFLLRKLLATQASIDPLTGLPNRRAFRWRVESGLRHCEREQRPAILAVVDVDHFKLFNDHYGHAGGDVALQKVADVIRHSARRPLDITARVGGEEFCIFLFDVDVTRAKVPLEGILNGVRELALTHDTAPRGIMTVSMGAAVFDGTESLDTLYRRADDALYHSKTTGRDSLYFAEQ